jgi:hypothetical protein
MLFNQLTDDMFFKFPSMDMHFPRMHFPKISSKDFSKDFAGGQATMTTTKFHCINGVCDGQVTGHFPYS